MANGDDEIIHWIHTLWSAGLTVLGTLFAGMVKWNWDKLNNELDKKANKLEITDAFQVLRDDFERWREDSAQWRANQDLQHRENRQRLDAILMNLGHRKP